MLLQYIITMEKWHETLCLCGYQCVSLSQPLLLWRSLAEIQISLPLFSQAASLSTSACLKCPPPPPPPSPTNTMAASHPKQSDYPPKQLAPGSALSGLERITPFPLFPSFRFSSAHGHSTVSCDEINKSNHQSHTTWGRSLKPGMDILKERESRVETSVKKLSS